MCVAHTKGVGGRPEQALNLTRVHLELKATDLSALALVRHNFTGHLTAERGDLALKVTHTALTSVAAHHKAQRAVEPSDLGLLDPVSADLLGEEVALDDVELLLFGVARDLKHLKAVLKGEGDLVAVVGGGDEHDL